MVEFWAVIGLACLDRTFLNELKEHAPDVDATIREYGFRLSRFEMGELKRVLRIPVVLQNMESICHIAWEIALNDPEPCAWSAATSKIHDPRDHVHPYVNDPKVEESGFVLGGTGHS
jgi:hypothetical protein